MGIILDTSVLIAGERRGEGVRAILPRVQATHGEQDAALSVVTLVELTHGIYRARTDADRARRRAFSEELRRDMAVHPSCDSSSGHPFTLDFSLTCAAHATMLPTCPK